MAVRMRREAALSILRARGSDCLLGFSLMEKSSGFIREDLVPKHQEGEDSGSGTACMPGFSGPVKLDIVVL
jgi:hypothetical protein